MNKYIALLRAVNVSGKNKIPMKELIVYFSEIGFENIKYYLQTGNIVFDCDLEDPNRIAKKIANLIFEKYNYEVACLVFTKSDFLNIIDAFDLSNIKNLDTKNLYYTLFTAPIAGDLTNIELPKQNDDYYLFKTVGAIIYCPAGYGNTKMTNSLLEKKLKTTATTRNWNTISAIKELLKDNS